VSSTVAVLGPGGVGGFLAAMLSHTGDDVVVLARDETAQEIARAGLRLESGVFGSFDTTVRTATVLAEPVDAVLVTVKATQLSDALARVPPDAVGDAIVVPFLNGLEHVEVLRSAYPAGSVVAATIRIEAARVETGLVRHASPFAAVEVAPAESNRDRAARLVDELKSAGIEVRTRDDEPAMLWDKFALLAPFALLTTHARGAAGAIRTGRIGDLVPMLRETAAVAAADGVNIDPDGILAFIESMPASMESSMQRDQAAGRPMELDALGGALLRRAARHGVDVPVVRRIVAELEERSGQRVSV